MKDYLIKYSSSKRRELKYDFMPDILEIIEKPANKGGTFIIWMIFTLICTAILWAAFFKLDIVVTASGVVTPEGNMNIVQSSMGGTIENILIKEGDYVKKGEDLIELSQELNDIDIDKIEYNLELMKIQKEIYTKIYNGTEIDKIDAEKYEPYQWVVKCIIEEENIYKNDLSGLELQIRSSSSKELSDLQMDSFSMQRNLEIMEKISSCEGKIKENEAALAKYTYGEKENTIKAPVSGYVTQLAVNTLGQVIQSTQTVAGISPDDATLIFKCYLPDADIMNIELGQTVQMKLKAFPYAEYGAIEGTIEYISPAAQAVEGIGYVYTVNISYDNERMGTIPGMSGTAEILAGKRTVLEYFMEPISKGFRNSLKEK